METDIQTTLAGDISGADGQEAPEFYLASLNRQNRENMNVALRSHGLKIADWRLLQCLDRGVSLSVADLAELAVLERSVTSRLIEKLVHRGLARKKPSPADRRFSEITITKAGAQKLAESKTTIDHLRTQLFEGLSQDDYETLLRILQTMRKNARTYERPPATGQ